MTRVFADTSFFVAAIAPRDAYDRRAIEFSRAFEGEVWTTEFVIVELGNYLFRIKDRPFFEPILKNIRQSAQYRIIEATHGLLERGIQRFVDRPDKKWSLTDCISFVVMEEQGITEALTSDGDFGQLGFKALLLN